MDCDTQEIRPGSFNGLLVFSLVFFILVWFWGVLVLGFFGVFLVVFGFCVLLGFC